MTQPAEWSLPAAAPNARGSAPDAMCACGRTALGHRGGPWSARCDLPPVVQFSGPVLVCRCGRIADDHAPGAWGRCPGCWRPIHRNGPGGRSRCATCQP